MLPDPASPPPVPARLLDGVGEATRRRLERTAVQHRFRTGETLVSQGETPSDLFVIRRGQVKIWRGLENGVAMAIGLVPPGETIGLPGVLSGSPARSIATALTPVDVMALPVSVFRTEMARDPRLSFNVSQQLLRYLQQVGDRMEELAAQSAERRLARVMVALVRPFGDTRDPGPVEVRQNDLAELARTTVPTVSRLLKRWRDEGVVATRRGQVTVRDMPRLVGIGRDTG